MRFFHFIEKYHRVGFLADGLSQHAAFAIADIARRGTNQPRDGVLLLELGHIDGGQVLATAVEQLCQLQDGFGFTHATGTSQQKRAKRASRTAQVGACGQQVFMQAGNRQSWPLMVSPSHFGRSVMTDISFCDRRLSGTPVHSAITAAICFLSTCGETSNRSLCRASSSAVLCQPLYRGNCFSGLFRLYAASFISRYGTSIILF